MENVSPDKRILGNLAYYFWLYDYAYASPGIPARVSRLSRSEEAQNNPAGFWDEVAIDIFISDQSFDVVEFLPPGYLESRGYEILVEKGPVTIYGKPGVLASGAAENAPAY